MKNNTMESFINFIYNHLFHARIDNKKEGQFFENFIQTKIKKMKQERESDLDDFIEKRYYKKLLRQIKNLLDIESFKGYKILEMGSGTGLLSLYMGREGAEVTLLDSSKSALIYSSMLYQAMKRTDKFSGKVKFVHRSFLSQSFLLDEKFDIVHNSGVIEHYNFTTAINIVKKMQEKVKNNGYVIVCVPNYFCPNLIFTWLKYQKGTEQFYGKNRLKEIIEKAYLDFEKVETSTFVYPDWVPRFIIKKFQKLEDFLGKVFNMGFLYIGIGKKKD